MIALSGLGTDYRIDCNSGLTIDCDAWGNLLNPTCWGICSASQLPAGTTPPSGGSGSPGGSTTPPPVYTPPSLLTQATGLDLSGGLGGGLLIVGGLVALV